MSFYVAKSEPSPAEALLASDAFERLHPEIYEPRLEAVKELRQADDGTLHRKSGFRRVASFTNIPVFSLATTLMDPDFMKDKKKFYAFLRKNRKFCTYDIRSHTVAPGGTQTYIDGKPV